MLALLLTFLPLATASNMKPLSYGVIASAETLMALPTPVAVKILTGEAVQDAGQSSARIRIAVEPRDEPLEVFHTIANTRGQSQYLEAAFERDADSDAYNASIEITEITERASSLARRDDEQDMKDLMAEFKGDPDFRGILQMNCKHSPEACKNACFWQNCLVKEGGPGLNPRQKYQTDRNNQKDDRVTSGNEVDRGPPCRNWPLSQRFWDQSPQGRAGNLIRYAQDDKKTNDDKANNRIALQADEWPMASMLNGPFDKAKNDKVPQHTLRCIPRDDNASGGRWLNNFYGQYKDYSHDPNSLGRWRDYRVDTGDMLDKDGWFFVNFNFEDFVDGQDDALRDELKWCHSPSKETCVNDGYQFHMTSLMQNPKAKANKGRFEWPYDIVKDNTYQITQPGKTTGDIHQYWLYIHESTSDNKISITIQEDQNGEMVELAHHEPEQLDSGDSITVEASGDLKQDVRVTKKKDNGGTHYDILYAPDSVREWQQLRIFPFDTQTSGDGQRAGAPFARNDNKDKWQTPYCMPCPRTGKLNKQRAAKEKNKSSVQWVCSFPGW